jgi:hypothetical protein
VSPHTQLAAAVLGAVLTAAAAAYYAWWRGRELHREMDAVLDHLARFENNLIGEPGDPEGGELGRQARNLERLRLIVESEPPLPAREPAPDPHTDAPPATARMPVVAALIPTTTATPRSSPRRAPTASPDPAPAHQEPTAHRRSAKHDRREGARAARNRPQRLPARRTPPRRTHEPAGAWRRLRHRRNCVLMSKPGHDKIAVAIHDVRDKILDALTGPVRLRPQLQVRRVVVRLDAVPVVNRLLGIQRPPDHLGHHESVQVDVPLSVGVGMLQADVDARVSVLADYRLLDLPRRLLVGAPPPQPSGAPRAVASVARGPVARRVPARDRRSPVGDALLAAPPLPVAARPVSLTARLARLRLCDPRHAVNLEQGAP